MKELSTSQEQDVLRPGGMEKLLDGAESARALRHGEVVEGTIAQVALDAILVHIGMKTEGVVPAREMRSLGSKGLEQLKVGDPILVTVIHSEKGEGQVLLSYDRAQIERSWRLLAFYSEKGEIFEAEVTGYNKGGVTIRVGELQGFVPRSQLVSGVEAVQQSADETTLSQLVGKQLQLKIIELDRKRNRVILSERMAVREWRQQQKERLLRELKEGQVVRGKVTGIASFGAFVNLGGIDGLIHVSELSWDMIKSPEEVVKVGDEIDVYILKIDQENKKISLSLKRLKPEPWATVTQKYKEGELVKGTITRLTSFGAFAKLESGIEGLVHITELSDRRVHHPKEVVQEGDILTLKIVRIEEERRRLALSLKQVEEAEALQWLAQQASQPIRTSQ